MDITQIGSINSYLKQTKLQAQWNLKQEELREASEVQEERPEQAAEQTEQQTAEQPADQSAEETAEKSDAASRASESTEPAKADTAQESPEVRKVRRSKVAAYTQWADVEQETTALGAGGGMQVDTNA